MRQADNQLICELIASDRTKLCARGGRVVTPWLSSFPFYSICTSPSFFFFSLLIFIPSQMRHEGGMRGDILPSVITYEAWQNCIICLSFPLLLAACWDLHQVNVTMFMTICIYFNVKSGSNSIQSDFFLHYTIAERHQHVIILNKRYNLRYRSLLPFMISIFQLFATLYHRIYLCTLTYSSSS